MKTFLSRILSLFLAVSLLFCLAGCKERTSEDPYENALLRAVDYLYGDVGVANGAEWLALGLAGREGLAPKKGWEKQYAKSVAKDASECDGVFAVRKMTDQAGVIIGVTAAGYDASDFEGYDLTLPLADYEKSMLQGINGAAWALIALDFGGYEMPEDPNVPVQATKDMYVDYILSRQLPDGGFAFAANAAQGDPDMTGMVLVALSNYTYREDVALAVERGVSCLSVLQNEDGGYTSYGLDAAESCAQVIIALMRLGIPLDDPRFVKNGRTVMDKLMEYCSEDGGFEHVLGEGVNGVATEQAILAIVSWMRVSSGESDIFSIYS